MALYLLIGAGVLFLDQATKWLVQTRMVPFQSLHWIDGVLSLTYVKNYGAAFGVLYYQTFLLIGVTLVLFAVLWINRRRWFRQPFLFRIGMTVALGGAIGNFSDRVRLGYVVDFLDLPHWPVFNIADAAIVSGCALIVYSLLREELKKDGHRKQLPEEFRGGE